MRYEIVCAIFIFCGIFFICLMPLISRMDNVDFYLRKNLGKVGVGIPDFKQKAKKSVVGLISRVLGPEKYYSIKTSLVQAGKENTDPDVIYFIGIVIAIVMSIISSAAFSRTGSWVIIYICISAVVGFKLPEIYISSKANYRAKKMQSTVLTFTELLYVACEAGLDLDYAVKRISDAQDNVLAYEFRRTWNEFKKTDRENAIHDMMIRCNRVQDVRLLLEAIQQQFKTGTPMAQLLRDQANRIRLNAKNRVLEKGQKASFKLLIPLFAFELPSFLMIIGIPVAINISKIIQQSN